MKAYRLYYFVSLLEGAALMATELVAAKLIAPYYGHSIYVWTAVLASTLGGLALGYYAGGEVTEKNSKSHLSLALLFIAGYMILLPYYGSFVMRSFLSLPVKIAISISMFLILTPVMISYGIVSPIIINILGKLENNPGKTASKVFSISTVGGILSTLVFNLSIIIKFGIKKSCAIISMMIILALGISLFQNWKSKFNLVAIFFIFLLNSCSSTGKGLIKIHIAGTENKINSIGIKEYNPSSKELIESISKPKSTISFSKINPKTLYVLVLEQGEIPIYFDNEPIEVVINSDNLAMPEVSGDAESTLFNDKFIRFQRLKANYQNNNLIVSTYINNGGKFGFDDEGRAFERQADESEMEYNKFLKECTKELIPPASLYFALQLHQKFDYHFLENYRNTLPIDDKNTIIGSYFNNYVEYIKHTRISQKLEIPPTQTINNQNFDIRKLNNRYVWIFFWASFCHASIVEMRAMENLWPLLKEKDILPVFISLDYFEEQSTKEAFELKLPETYLICDGRSFESPLYKAANVDLIPSNILLDKDQKTISMNIKPDDVKRAISELK